MVSKAVSVEIRSPRIFSSRVVHIPDNLMVEAGVSFMRGDVSDIGLIDVTITKNNDCTTKPECQRRVFIFA